MKFDNRYSSSVLRIQWNQVSVSFMARTGGAVCTLVDPQTMELREEFRAWFAQFPKGYYLKRIAFNDGITLSVGFDIEIFNPLIAAKFVEDFYV